MQFLAINSMFVGLNREKVGLGSSSQSDLTIKDRVANTSTRFGLAMGPAVDEVFTKATTNPRNGRDCR